MKGGISRDEHTFQHLKKAIKLDRTGKRKIKIALLGDTATQFLATAVTGAGYYDGLDIDIWEADFNQVERQVFDPGSELYEFEPEIVIVFLSTHKLLTGYNKLAAADYLKLADNQLELLAGIYTEITEKLQAKLIFYNYCEIDDSVFGSFANKLPFSFLFQLRKLNYELMLLAAKEPGLYICDISSIQNLVGKNNFFSTSIYINTEMVLSIDVLPAVAYKTTAIIKSLYGDFKKCLVLDLDNTMWGGIIGDDGIERIQVGTLGIGKAFSELQYWVKKLKNRGIIIAVCSKNTESVAKEPFLDHKEMVLKLDDIAVFVANWENKVDNLHHIQQTLNIGFDSMVFLDDNPFERNMVRENIPAITVPELPIDPADYLEYLYPLNLFEVTSYSEQDDERTKQYQVEAKRNEVKKGFADEEAFLLSLDMCSVVEPFTKFNAPRVAQLSQRSNQFNLRTVRYTEAEIESLIAAPGYYTFSFTLEDRFGDNGLICVIILKEEDPATLFIDTWLMSCRVLKRSMENFVLNTILSFAKGRSYKYLKGEYIPTAKNEMVKDHYRRLGFTEESDSWILNVNDHKEYKTFIKVK